MNFKKWLEDIQNLGKVSDVPLPLDTELDWLAIRQKEKSFREKAAAARNIDQKKHFLDMANKLQKTHRKMAKDIGKL